MRLVDRASASDYIEAGTQAHDPFRRFKSPCEDQAQTHVLCVGRGRIQDLARGNQSTGSFVPDLNLPTPCVAATQGPPHWRRSSCRLPSARPQRAPTVFALPESARIRAPAVAQPSAASWPTSPQWGRTSTPRRTPFARHAVVVVLPAGEGHRRDRRRQYVLHPVGEGLRRDADRAEEARSEPSPTEVIHARQEATGSILGGFPDLLANARELRVTPTCDVVHAGHDGDIRASGPHRERLRRSVRSAGGPIRSACWAGAGRRTRRR